MNRQNRDVSLDLIRAVATLMVVLNHAVLRCYPIEYGNIVHFSIKEQLFCLTAYTVGCVGVPLFLMLTGYLLLPREYDEARIIGFYRHNLLPMFVVWEIWTLLFQVYGAWFNGTSFDLQGYIHCALFLELPHLPHAWYMPMILGIYLVLPMIAIALSHLTGRILALLMVISYLAFYVLPTIMVTGEIHQISMPNLSMRLDVGFLGGAYGLYLLLGYCLARYQERLRNILSGARLVLVVAAVIILGGATVAFQLIAYHNSYVQDFLYDFALLPIIGVGTFLILDRIRMPAWWQRVATSLAAASFGMYLIHYPIEQLLQRYLGETAYPAINLICLTVITYLLSWLLVWLAGKTQLGRKLFRVR